jgi:KaiC/GvpD/RAD55 family RecA-like ATPase
MNKDYEELRNKAKSFGFNFDSIIQEAQEQIIKAILPEIQGRIEAAVKANVPTIQEIVEILSARLSTPKTSIEDIVNQVVARIPTSGVVEEARIIK